VLRLALAAEGPASLRETISPPGGELEQGTLFAGKYRIIALPGRGGMGVVFTAEDVKLKRAVALTSCGSIRACLRRGPSRQLSFLAVRAGQRLGSGRL
jgi:hypothetical protein